MDPILLLIVGGLGLVVCLVLLFFGVNMLREERKAKAAAPANRPADGPHPPPASTPDKVIRDRRPSKIVTGEGESQAINESRPNTPLREPSPAGSSLTGGMARLTAGVMARMPHGAAAGGAHEVMRVLRDNLTGRIQVELGGQRYANPGEVQDADLRQALQTILTDLKTFQSGGAAGDPMGLSQPAAGSAVDGAASAEPTEAFPPPRASAAPAPRPAGNEARPLPKPTMNPFKQMAVLREIAKNPPPPTMTFAEQIDAVLQDHIEGTPLAGRGIKMRQGPRGDAIFDLDGVSFTGVEELPDEAVRVVVQAAIAEWEAKQ